MHLSLLRRALLALSGALLLASSSLSFAEPPSRAARLGYFAGTVSFAPAGQPDWVQAVLNRPLTTGDSLWADANSRAELQLGGTAIRMGALTSLTLVNLDDRITQVQLSQGTVKIRIRWINPGQSVEVDTPNLAFSLNRPGEYRVDVDPQGDATAVKVQSGQAQVFGAANAYTVGAQQGYRFYGSDLTDYDPLVARPDDDVDRWARERDQRIDRSPSARYVSPSVVGYEDLDANGTWRPDPTYGNVWIPNRVAANWTPYHDGHWAWVDPWGWTWVDDAPWGYAVSHYGRWANMRGTWGWVPGPPRERAVYAPALVAFVGGSNFRVSLSVGGAVSAAVGWFPLAPREVYQPSYPVSRGYFDQINRSNAVIAPAIITKNYNNTTIINNTTIVNNTTNVKIVYVNQQVRGAVVAVPAQAFAQSQPVARTAVPWSREAANAPVSRAAAVAPVAQSVHGGAPAAGARPPGRERALIARTAPPPAPVAFAAQQQQLAAKPGVPIDDTQRRQFKPAAPAAAAPRVNVVTTAQAPAPTAPPPKTAPALKTPQARQAEAARTQAGAPDRARNEPDGRRERNGNADPQNANRPDPRGPDAARQAEAVKADAARNDAKAAADKSVKDDAAKRDAAKAEAVKADAAKADAAKADAKAAADKSAKDDAAKRDAAKADTARSEAKAAADKSQAAKGDAAKRDAAKAEAAKADAARSEAKGAADRSQAAKDDAGRRDAARSEAAKADAARGEAKGAADRSQAAKDDAGRRDAARAEAAKADAARGDAKAAADRAQAAKDNVVKRDAAKASQADAARNDAKAAADRAQATRDDAAKRDAAKADAAKADAARAEAAKAAAAKADAAKADAAKADAARAEAARAAAAKAAAAKADAAKADAAQAGAARAAAAKAEADKREAARPNEPREPRGGPGDNPEREKGGDRRKGRDEEEQKR